MGQGQSSRLQAGRDSRIGWHQRHQHPFGAERAGPASTGWIEIVWTNQSGQQQVGEPGEALGPQQGHVGVC